jgi:aspartate racemase
MAARRLVGVLGGMGPLATVDYMQKVIEATPAERDQDHVPLVVYSVPQIPDRVSAISAGTDEPFPAMLAGLRILQRAGAELIVIPCNTAHAWYDRLAASTDVKIIHIAEAVVSMLPPKAGAIALLATVGTLRAGFYQRYLEMARIPVLVPEPADQGLIGNAIAAVKRGDIESAQAIFDHVAARLLTKGADVLLLACTELPVAAKGSAHAAQCLDATDCLARTCVALSSGADAVAALAAPGG